MKTICSLLCIALLFMSCQEKVDNTAELKFEANSKTVLANLQQWQDENLDYSVYADDFVLLETMFGAEKDSISLEEMKESDKRSWEYFDFKMLNEPVLLPGVNPDTKEPDGSVRHYSTWEVTLPATDSTEAKSGKIKLYESFDFNDEGKIAFQQIYGDFTGLLNHLMKKEETMDNEDMAEE
ncbi:hypothetical protein [Aestuariivivens sediminis]|uniref:hypothetical protein n=1 Tax=Aestuariivivens sediminis TaxID=2913557 RepID=UPI001F567220|nr:hypothetical protein [Aestuariivivens sediminis]